MEYAQFFSHIRICSVITCNNIACDATDCERHNGIRPRCNGIKRDGTRCFNNCNDSGERCGIHGGLSKQAIYELNRFLRVRTIDRNRPQFHTVLRFVQYRLALQNTTIVSLDNHENIISADDLISSFAKVSISDDCAICLSEIEDGVEHPCCKKVSCSECMKKWVVCSSNCPYCRTKLRGT
jgi:hypothetical protein